MWDELKKKGEILPSFRNNFGEKFMYSTKPSNQLRLTITVTFQDLEDISTQVSYKKISKGILKYLKLYG